MTIAHHPSDETLMLTAAGTLPAGPSLVVISHCDMCAACGRRLGLFETVGGVLLEGLPPDPISEKAVEILFDRIHGERLATRMDPEKPAPGLPTYPQGLSRATVGKARWLAPGFRRSEIRLPEAPEARVMLMRIGAGRMMPEHGHTGMEYTLVLSGSFSDKLGHYGPGDFVELDASIEHQPVVDSDGECICLAALEGKMRLSSLVGRLVQWLIPL